MVTEKNVSSWLLSDVSFIDLDKDIESEVEKLLVNRDGMRLRPSAVAADAIFNTFN